jgi:hypothetical protein
VSSAKGPAANKRLDLNAQSARQNEIKPMSNQPEKLFKNQMIR